MRKVALIVKIVGEVSVVRKITTGMRSAGERESMLRQCRCSAMIKASFYVSINVSVSTTGKKKTGIERGEVILLQLNERNGVDITWKQRCEKKTSALKGN